MNKKSIVKQAGILAIAGIIVRIIGVLYRSPLTALIGDEGNGYYSTAYNIYAMILLISSYSIPTAISKLVSEKIALGKYADAKKVFQCAILYITVVAGSAAVLAFILAPWIVDQGAVPAYFPILSSSRMTTFMGSTRTSSQTFSWMYGSLARYSSSSSRVAKSTTRTEPLGFPSSSNIPPAQKTRPFKFPMFSRCRGRTAMRFSSIFAPS